MKTQVEINEIVELLNAKKVLEAEKKTLQELKKNPQSEVLYNLLGAILAEQQKLNEAVINYKKSIEINNNYAQAYNNLGTAFHKLNKKEKAVENYHKAIKLKKNFAEACNNLGNVMRDLNKPKESLLYLNEALKIKPNYAEAYNNLGLTHNEFGNKQDAIKNFKKALEHKPNYAEVYNSLGISYSDVSNFEESLFCYNKAIKLKKDYAIAYNNLGNLFSNLGKHDEANTEYKNAIRIKPDYARAYSNLLFNLNYKNDFDPVLYLEEAKRFRKNCKSIKKKILFEHKHEKEPKKLKLGFVSADFGNHPGGFFTLSTLKELKKKNFELIAYSTTERNDELSSYFRPLFNKWNIIEKKSDEDVVEEIFNEGIHILIDLQGHSAKNRLPIFIYKPAPIQVTWLGQGSTGINEIDYFVGSPQITPKHEEKYYVEKIYRLPKISQCFTPPSYNLEIKSLPAKKNKFITFGCLNKLTKVNDTVISLWSKILLSVPKSKILLKNKDLDNKKIYESFIQKFKKNKINEDRIILLGESKTRKELLETYNEIDIALDPFPFQGNTSTCESIWMGVPVITLKGDRYLFHFGESINTNINMKNWIAKDFKEYIDIAKKCSSDIDKLSDIRINLRKVALQSPVFDALSFSQNLDYMFWEMWNKFKKIAS